MKQVMGRVPASDFTGGPLDRVGGAHAPPIGCGHGVESEEGFPVPQEGGDGLGGALPGKAPAVEGALGGGAGGAC